MPTGKQKSFFATKNDLLPGLENLTKKLGLVYVDGTLHDTPDIRVYENLADYEGLGISKWGNHNDNYFQAFEKGKGPIIRAIPQRAGGTKYSFVNDSHSLQLFLSGVYRDIVLWRAESVPCQMHTT